MSLLLYNAPQSTCSQRVCFVLHAKGIAFAERRLDLFAGDQLRPAYLELNPNGLVPTLVHDGKVIIDSSVIMEYLEEVFGREPPLVPEDPVERAAMRSLMRFIIGGGLVGGTVAPVRRQAEIGRVELMHEARR